MFFLSFHWRVQNSTIPCRSQDLLPFLSVMYFFLPPFSTNYSSTLSHLIFPPISWSASQSCCFQIDCFMWDHKIYVTWGWKTGLWVVPRCLFKEMKGVMWFFNLYSYSFGRYWFVITVAIKSFAKHAIWMCRNKKQITLVTNRVMAVRLPHR
jgi:hypothetical protein